LQHKLQAPQVLSVIALICGSIATKELSIGPGIQRDLATAIKRCAVHPDTDVPLLGFAVPGWSEVVKLAVRAHQAFSTLHFVGWDIAVLQSGPVLVEGNEGWNPDVVVLSHGISFSDTQFIPYFNYHADRLPTGPLSH
jgi:Sugar-transfer associated ATP-grasp